MFSKVTCEVFHFRIFAQLTRLAGAGWRLQFAGTILRSPSHVRAEWADNFAAMSIEKPALKGLKRANKARWLKPEIRVRAQHSIPTARSGMLR